MAARRLSILSHLLWSQPGDVNVRGRETEANGLKREDWLRLRVTQTVNGSKGIHCMIAKSVVHG